MGFILLCVIHIYKRHLQGISTFYWMFLRNESNALRLELNTYILKLSMKQTKYASRGSCETLETERDIISTTRKVQERKMSLRNTEDQN